MIKMKGLAVSVVYLICCILSVYIGSIKFNIDQWDLRKVFHIEMANWWWIRVLFFYNRILASIGPLIFILINFIYEKKKGDSKYGMTQFAIALLCCVIYSFCNRQGLIYATIAMMVLGFADSIAALIGRRFCEERKTWQGTVTFGLVAFLVLLTANILGYIQGHLLQLGMIATLLAIIEAKVFPKFDNILLPAFTILFLYLI